MTNQQKLENLMTQALNLQAEIEELKQECKEPTYWEPANGEKVWTIVFDDILCANEWTEDYDRSLIYRGLIFRTKEEAQQELKLQQAIYRLKKAIWKTNGGVNLNFMHGCTNYYVQYIHATKTLKLDYSLSQQCQPSWMYIEDKEKALNLMDTHKKDFLTYFGIKGE